MDNTDDEGNEIKTGQVVCIDTGSPVNSAGFGSGTPESQLVQPAPQRNYWTRFDFTSQEMIFATGHVNGRIRIWDVCTGRKLLELMDHTEAVRDLAFAPDGSLRLVSASLDHTIKGDILINLVIIVLINGYVVWYRSMGFARRRQHVQDAERTLEGSVLVLLEPQRQTVGQ